MAYVLLMVRVISVEIDMVGNGPPGKKPHTNGVNFLPRQVNGSTSGSASGTRTPAGEEWELDCEICFRRGINQVSSSCSNSTRNAELLFFLRMMASQ